MTTEQRKRALMKLENRYDRLSAQACELVHRLRLQASPSRRAQLLGRLRPIDKQRSAIDGQMADLWESD